MTEWTTTLANAVARFSSVVLVAHSLGCLVVAHWARRGDAARHTVSGALLVAPPDVDRPGMNPELAGFAPIPTDPLPFTTILVASRTDPWITYERARALADAWSATLTDAGDAGHLNTAAGFGPWPQGEVLLADLRGAAE